MARRTITITPQKEYWWWLMLQGKTPNVWDTWGLPRGYSKFCEDKDEPFWVKISEQVVEALEHQKEIL